jgi:rSAM/selenodomain-associated transferase 2
MQTNSISIIIPTLNEAAGIGRLISFLVEHNNNHVKEIIIADAGSLDDTISIAAKAGAKTVRSPKKGRAAQMNYGAGFATGDILYFIHADSFPPESYTKDIINAIGEGFSSGRYRTTFDSRKFILKINAFFTRFDWFICYGGDQTFFITRDLFKKIGGYNDSMLIMEDYEIVKRAKRAGRYKIFSKPALVSARKYDTNSWLAVQLANRKIVKMYKQGVSQEEMVRKYKQLLFYR